MIHHDERRPPLPPSSPPPRRNLFHNFMLIIAICFLTILISNTFVHRVDYIPSSMRSTKNGKMMFDFKLPNSLSWPGPLTFDKDVGLKFRETDERNEEEMILSADVHLIQVHIPHGALSPNNEEGSYRGVKGVFCKLNWEKQKADPPSVPMFRDLIQHSPHCHDKHSAITVDLHSILPKLRTYDSQITSPTHSIPPTGFIFHESRCGSTLVANALTASNPEQTRVYSESSPLITALRACDGSKHGWGVKECHPPHALQLLRDVVYVMGRSSHIEERYLFFKVQSIGTKLISHWREAFPNVPWVFVFRDPVQVMMSHLDVQRVEKANCLRSWTRPAKDMVKLVEEYGRKVEELSQVEFCAAHLATLCNTALQEHLSSSTGRMLNYADIPQRLIEEILPQYFHVPVGPEEERRISDVCTRYSKGRKRTGAWVEDSDTKEKNATPEIRKASDFFLKQTFEVMQKV